MRTRLALLAAVALIAGLVAGCGGDDNASGGSQAGSSEPVKVAMLTKFPVAFFTAMDDAAKRISRYLLMQLVINVLKLALVIVVLGLLPSALASTRCAGRRWRS